MENRCRTVHGCSLLVVLSTSAAIGRTAAIGCSVCTYCLTVPACGRATSALSARYTRRTSAIVVYATRGKDTFLTFSKLETSACSNRDFPRISFDGRRENVALLPLFFSSRGYARRYPRGFITARKEFVRETLLKNGTRCRLCVKIVQVAYKQINFPSHCLRQ